MTALSTADAARRDQSRNLTARYHLAKTNPERFAMEYPGMSARVYVQAWECADEVAQVEALRRAERAP